MGSHMVAHTFAASRRSSYFCVQTVSSKSMHLIETCDGCLVAVFPFLLYSLDSSATLYYEDLLRVLRLVIMAQLWDGIPSSSPWLCVSTMTIMIPFRVIDVFQCM